MAGVLYGIGVGPGDPELLTLKAVKTIRECQVIATPGERCEDSAAYQIAVQAVPELAQKELCPIVMPMMKDQAALQSYYREGAARLTEQLEQGKNVGFLTLGDVTVYSTYLYLYGLVREAGYETRMINGIPSFCAAAARLNMGLAEGAGQIHVVPASYQIQEALTWPGTRILMKSGRRLAKVKEELTKSGLKAVMVERCGMEGERVFSSLEEIPEDAGYYSLMIVKDEDLN